MHHSRLDDLILIKEIYMFVSDVRDCNIRIASVADMQSSEVAMLLVPLNMVQYSRNFVW